VKWTPIIRINIEDIGRLRSCVIYPHGTQREHGDHDSHYCQAMSGQSRMHPCAPVADVCDINTTPDIIAAFPRVGGPAKWRATVGIHAHGPLARNRLRW
jgi:hypothetical protein